MTPRVRLLRFAACFVLVFVLVFVVVASSANASLRLAGLGRAVLLTDAYGADTLSWVTMLGENQPVSVLGAPSGPSQPYVTHTGMPLGDAGRFTSYLNAYFASTISSVSREAALVVSPLKSQLVLLDATGQPASCVDLGEAYLTAAVFPRMESSSSEAASFELWLAPSPLSWAAAPRSSQVVPSWPAGLESSTARRVARNGYQLTISGLDAREVTRLDSIVITTPATYDATRRAYVATQSRGSNLTFGISATGATADGLLAWQQKYFSEGPAREISITYSNRDRRPVLTLKGTGAYIASVQATLVNDTPTTSVVRAILGVKQWSVSFPNSAPSNTKPGTGSVTNPTLKK